ncbi:hypothetical protein [Arcticibacter svalbardensis]|nr:hypothetical protein [Arcticibacter svalbardensis]
MNNGIIVVDYTNGTSDTPLQYGIHKPGGQQSRVIIQMGLPLN